MDPLFKWPGGKSSELKYIRPLVPDYKRFIEPFAGGAAVFFDLEPEEAVINDINPNLTEAYKMIGSSPDKIKKELENIAGARKHAALFAEKNRKAILSKYRKAKSKSDLSDVVDFVKSKESQFNSLKQSNWADDKKLFQCMLDSIKNKIGRTYSHEQKSGVWKDEDVFKQIDTAFHAGLYTYIRDVHKTDTRAKEVAKFLYLREFCYGAMFRYNKEGKFNIPYGGHSYNKKSLSDKIKYWFDDKTVKLLKRTDVLCGSFEDISGKIKIKKDDFIFLDPPYDTEFSEYDQFSFEAQQQKELAEWYRDLPCPALMIIGKTPLIEKLYKEAAKINPSIEIEEYEKNYTYNVRGRNNRGITHLAIRNYPKPKP